MLKKYVVVVHNVKWGDYYKEFDKKKDAMKYRMECNNDINTYAWLYKYVEVTEEQENKLADQLEKEEEKKESEKIPSDPLKELEEELNKAHTEYLKAFNSNASKGEVQAKRDIYIQLSEEYKEKFQKTLKSKN